MPALRCWTVGQKKAPLSLHTNYSSLHMLLSKERELREYKPWQNPPVKLMNMSGFALVKPPINLYNFNFDIL